MRRLSENACQESLRDFEKWNDHPNRAINRGEEKRNDHIRPSLNLSPLPKIALECGIDFFVLSKQKVKNLEADLISCLEKVVFDRVRNL